MRRLRNIGIPSTLGLYAGEQRLGAMSERGEIVFPDLRQRTPTILVVDDEVLIRFMVSDFLQECGFKTLGASNADEAVQVLSAQNPFAIDLVLSDVRMPGSMDGFGLAQWVRENRPGLPVVMCSGDNKKADAAAHLCAGEAFLKKPVDLDVAVLQIRQLLDGRQMRK
jgi:CheY-like chemotaxis protein